MFMHLSPKERFGYIALAAILLAGGGFVVAQKLRRPATIDLHETAQPPVSFDHGSGKGAARTTADPGSNSDGQIVVHVAGAVNKPGLVSLAPGSRVYDAVQAAGGPAEDANVDQINLAAKAVDGSRVFVPYRGQGAPLPAGTAPSSGSRMHGKHPADIVNVNSAGVEDLMALPGVGSVMAQRIVDYRTAHGSFHTVDDLMGVQGLGKRKLDQIRQWLTAD